MALNYFARQSVVVTQNFLSDIDTSLLMQCIITTFHNDTKKMAHVSQTELALKAPITAAADDKFCDIFPSL